MIIALPASENMATREMRGGYSILPYASSGLMNRAFTLSFFLSKLKSVRWKYVGFFILKMSFCRTETSFYDKPPALF